MANSKERTTPAKERVTQLDERLSELRTKIGSISERSPSSPPPAPARADGADDGATPEPPPTADMKPEMKKVTRLALLVFNTFKHEPRLLRRFVHELARLEAEQKK